MTSVKLIAVSQPTVEGIKSPEDLITYIARVSNPENQSKFETSSKLLRYLLEHGHWSPFEQVSLTMEVVTTRDIARQILRHRSFVFQEFSQRYEDPTKHLGFVKREARMQDSKNRQNSIEIVHEDGDRAAQLVDNWDAMQDALAAHALSVYKWAVSKGIAKEQARVVLPEGMTQSKLYVTGSLRSWIHYCQQRMGNGTQKEHVEVAELCWKILASQFPSVVSAIED